MDKALFSASILLLLKIRYVKTIPEMNKPGHKGHRIGTDKLHDLLYSRF